MNAKQLLKVTEEEKKAILAQINLTEEELNDSLDVLWDWYQKSELYVDFVNHNHLRNAILNSKGSMEKAKELVKGYFRIKREYSNFFNTCLPYTENYKRSKSYTRFAFLPDLSPDLCRIAVCKAVDPNGNCPDGMDYHVFPIMSTEVKIKTHDFFASIILIIDFEQLTLSNLLRYTPMANHTLVNMIIALKLRLRHIHLLNLSPKFNMVLGIMKSVLPGKFSNKLRVHPSYSSLYEYIPKEYLPADFGGDQESIDELYDKWCKTVESDSEYFEKLQRMSKMKISDTNRSSHSEGSFRKLAID